MKKRLFMATDDLTGALDSGVQLAKHGLRTTVSMLPWPGENGINPDADAVVVCTNSRHLPPDEARCIVKDIFSSAEKSGLFEFYFKKLDSTLRGNPGAEIQGMIQALGNIPVQLLNAFPGAGRTTKGGMQYVNGVPLDKTPFANDPFNPITSARIAEVIASQADISDMVTVHDAGTDADIDNAVERMEKAGLLKCLAGCAGLAGGIARRWNAEKPEKETVRGTPLILCGSLNPAAAAQMAEAEKCGITVMELPRAFIDGADGYAKEACDIIDAASKNPLIIRTPAPSRSVSDKDGAEMAAAMGRLFTALLASGRSAPTLVIGGDTLAACISGAGWKELTPIGEALPGTAIFRSGARLLLSRAGGFGDSETIVKTIQLMKEGIEL